MDFLKFISIAASGLRAQAGRMRIISENIANADSTASGPGGEPRTTPNRPPPSSGDTSPGPPRPRSHRGRP